ncbi:MAG TPA: hypothetical protein VFP68_00810 [Burkholderiaceae bacterium]|nr:hypothetical protein [Burkholderiaceae bacterium]
MRRTLYVRSARPTFLLLEALLLLLGLLYVAGLVFLAGLGNADTADSAARRLRAA